MSSSYTIYFKLIFLDIYHYICTVIRNFFKFLQKRNYVIPTISLITGMFMLWWGWLGFNCGSTFGVSGGRWKLASRSAVCTINASCGGGVFATFYSYFKCNR